MSELESWGVPKEIPELRLSFGEYMADLEGKENLINKLIGGIKDPGTPQEDRSFKISELKRIQGVLGAMRTSAGNAGEMLDITDKIKEMIEGKDGEDGINKVLQSVAH